MLNENVLCNFGGLEKNNLKTIIDIYLENTDDTDSFEINLRHIIQMIYSVRSYVLIEKNFPYWH